MQLGLLMGNYGKGIFISRDHRYLLTSHIGKYQIRYIVSDRKTLVETEKENTK